MMYFGILTKLFVEISRHNQELCEKNIAGPPGEIESMLLHLRSSFRVCQNIFLFYRFQVVKNLFYLSKLIIELDRRNLDNSVPSCDAGQSHEKASITGEASDRMTISLLLTKMCNIAKYESSQTPKLSQKVWYLLAPFGTCWKVYFHICNPGQRSLGHRDIVACFY